MRDKFTVGMVVGRLLEARVNALADVADVDAYSEAVGRSIAGTRSGTVILCADHRAVAVYAPPVADELAELFSRMNTRLERVAILVSARNATLSMQLQRIVREAKNPARRVFDEASEAASFLHDALTDAERARLAKFLDGG